MEKKKRRSKEEVLLEKIARQDQREAEQRQRLDKKAREQEEKNERKRQRAERKAAKEAEKAERRKPEPTESDLVHRYANRVIRNQQYHGRANHIEGYEYKTNTKNIWRDTDFYFSVVFQSAAQRDRFLEALRIVTPEEHAGGPIKIINGLKFAAALNIELQHETVKEYPTGNLDLMPFVLDDEVIPPADGDKNEV